MAAGLLPKLSLFASAGGSANNANNWNVRTADGGCCGATVATSLNTYGSDWSVGLVVSWLLFDAGTTRGEAQALGHRSAAVAQRYAARRNDIRLRIEQAFFGHEASLARLVAARRGVAASLEAFRDARLRYQAGLTQRTGSLQHPGTADRQSGAKARGHGEREHHLRPAAAGTPSHANGSGRPGSVSPAVDAMTPRQPASASEPPTGAGNGSLTRGQIIALLRTAPLLLRLRSCLWLSALGFRLQRSWHPGDGDGIAGGSLTLLFVDLLLLALLAGPLYSDLPPWNGSWLCGLRPRPCSTAPVAPLCSARCS